MTAELHGFHALDYFMDKALVPREGPTPYVGLFTNPETLEQLAVRSAAHVFVDCPTGGGKTSAVLAPAMILHPGPVLGVSSKDDLLKLVAERREGPIYLIDLRQIETPDYAELLDRDNIMLCRIDPTTLIKKHDDALNMATWLVRTSNMAMGGRVTQHGEPYWTNQIVPSLAAVLYAASPIGGNMGIDWALRCVLNPSAAPKDEMPAPMEVPCTRGAELAVDLARAKLAEAEALADAPSVKVSAAKLAVLDAQKALDSARAAASSGENEPTEPVATDELAEDQNAQLDGAEASQAEPVHVEGLEPSNLDTDEDAPENTAAAAELAGTQASDVDAGDEAAAESDEIRQLVLKLEVAQGNLAVAVAADKARQTKVISAKLEVWKAEETLRLTQAARETALAANEELAQARAEAQARKAEKEARRAERAAERALALEQGSDVPPYDPEDEDVPPSWVDVGQYIHEPTLLIDWLAAIGRTNPRQRDSVGLGMSGALFPWVYKSVNRTDIPIFRVEWLDRPESTLIILAEPEGGGVGAALPLVQSISTEWRRKTSLEIRKHNLLVGVDETTNTLPLHNYDVLASEARGLGINLMVCVQSTKQLANRYDAMYAEAVLSVFPAMLVMYGSTSDEPLEAGSQWSGLSHRVTETFDQSTGGRGLVPDEGPLILPIELMPTMKYTGRLIWRGSEGVILDFPSFEEFLEIYDGKLVAGLDRLAVPA